MLLFPMCLPSCSPDVLKRSIIQNKLNFVIVCVKLLPAHLFNHTWFTSITGGEFVSVSNCWCYLIILLHLMSEGNTVFTLSC